ncbi:conserved hypothetical protein [Candidatus Nitrotoga sp. BS]|nr:conserved hypothetical protein [Candidatus Nitrotoga sp. BS]
MLIPSLSQFLRLKCLFEMKNQKNIYELRFEHGIAIGLSIADAAIAVTEAYLDGKPARRGKHPFRAADKNAAFWSCQFLETLSADLYETEPFVLALARYMGQQQAANFELVRRIAQVAPEAVRRAVRYSGLVLRQNSKRWKEVERLAITEAAEFSEFIRVCHRFDHAHRDRVAEVEVNRKLLDDLTPLELLSYASLYAFEHMVPEAFNQMSKGSDTNIDSQEIWDAINDILIWKLQTCAGKAFHLTDAIISGSLRVHLSPLLFPSRDSLMFREDIHLAFGYLVSAHLELNSFLSRSVHAFCYKDSIRFEFAGTDLVIIEHDPDASSAWIRNGEKLARLHGYWYYRAMDEFVLSGMATKRIGRPENHEMNRIAYIKAIRTKLQLSEVYGLGGLVLADTGLQVDLFQALLSLELITAFYINDFILPYGEHLNNTGHWRSALTYLAIGGLLQSESQNQFHNRFPITWSDRAVKIESIRPWTVSENFPHGNAKAAEAILDFWTSDLGALSANLRGGGPTLTPDLFERPVLKMGRYLFQLPWMLAIQNNASAAINNLRRIGARRTEAKGETQRIENRLATLFKERGFHVCLNYLPEKTIENDPGEVDIICARDGQLLVLEIKSTFLRRSVKDAWLHKTTTLRKAGLQLRRKVEAVKAELTSNAKLALSLGIVQEDGMPLVRGWIVDTCIEHDHEFFSGFLKVSLEEVLIALRDDRHFLNDPNG